MRHSCMVLESALDRNQWRPSLDTATGVWGPDGVARTIIQGPQMVEMSSGAVRGGPQRVGTAACKEQSSGGLSAVQLLIKRWGKWSFGCETASKVPLDAGKENRLRSEQLERPITLILAFRDSTLRNSSRSPGNSMSSRNRLRQGKLCCVPNRGPDHEDDVLSQR